MVAAQALTLPGVQVAWLAVSRLWLPVWLAGRSAEPYRVK